MSPAEQANFFRFAGTCHKCGRRRGAVCGESGERTGDQAARGVCPLGKFDPAAPMRGNDPGDPAPATAAQLGAGGCCDPPKLNEPLPPATNADPVDPAARAEQAEILKLPPEQRPRTPE